MLEMLGSNTGSDIDYPEVFAMFLGFSRKISGHSVKLGHDNFVLGIISNSSFTAIQSLDST
jgi:hypothetical protein